MNSNADALPGLLARLQLTALRDQLDTLLDEATRRDLNLREALTFFCQAKVARREQRRLEMAVRLAKFPFARTVDGFDFQAQPSLDPKQVRELALCRWVANGDCLLLLGPPRPTTYCPSTPFRSHDPLSLPSRSWSARHDRPVSPLWRRGCLRCRATRWIADAITPLDDGACGSPAAASLQPGLADSIIDRASRSRRRCFTVSLTGTNPGRRA